MEIVIDTNVLEIASNPSGIYKEINLNAAELLNYIVRSSEVKVCLDHENLIMEEYKKRIYKSQFLAGWVALMRNKNKFFYYSSNMKQKIRNKLIILGFHPKDFKFVAVANNSNSKLIVVEVDSDWDNDVCAFLKTIELLVVNSKECLEIFAAIIKKS